MLRSECDKLYHGKCSCVAKSIERLPGEDHWCSSQINEATIIDSYHLPPGIERFYGNNNFDVAKISGDFFIDIVKDRKVHIMKNTRTLKDNSVQLIVSMKWHKEADFLPSWVWMIESGYNAKRDQYNKENNIEFSKQVITKTANFIITAGPYTTNTNNPPYHVDFKLNLT